MAKKSLFQFGTLPFFLVTQLFQSCTKFSEEGRENETLRLRRNFQCYYSNTLFQFLQKTSSFRNIGFSGGNFASFFCRFVRQLQVSLQTCVMDCQFIRLRHFWILQLTKTCIKSSKRSKVWDF